MTHHGATANHALFMPWGSSLVEVRPHGFPEVGGGEVAFLHVWASLVQGQATARWGAVAWLQRAEVTPNVSFVCLLAVDCQIWAQTYVPSVMRTENEIFYWFVKVEGEGSWEPAQWEKDSQRESLRRPCH